MVRCCVVLMWRLKGQYLPHPLIHPTIDDIVTIGWLHGFRDHFSISQAHRICFYFQFFSLIKIFLVFGWCSIWVHIEIEGACRILFTLCCLCELQKTISCWSRCWLTAMLLYGLVRVACWATCWNSPSVFTPCWLKSKHGTKSYSVALFRIFCKHCVRYCVFNVQ